MNDVTHPLINDVRHPLNDVGQAFSWRRSPSLQDDSGPNYKEGEAVYLGHEDVEVLGLGELALDRVGERAQRVQQHDQAARLVPAQA